MTLGLASVWAICFGVIVSAAYYIPKALFFLLFCVLRIAGKIVKRASDEPYRKAYKRRAESIVSSAYNVIFILIAAVAFLLYSYVMLDGAIRILPPVLSLASYLITRHFLLSPLEAKLKNIHNNIKSHYNVQ